MRISRFTVDRGYIHSVHNIETDKLNEERLAKAQRLLQRLQAGAESVCYSSGGSAFEVHLGLPRPVWSALEEKMRTLFPERRKTPRSYREHQHAQPVQFSLTQEGEPRQNYLVLSVAEDNSAESAVLNGLLMGSCCAGKSSCSLGDIQKRIEQIPAAHREILAVRPALVSVKGVRIPTPAFEADCRKFSRYFAAAILLKSDESGRGASFLPV